MCADCVQLRCAYMCVCYFLQCEESFKADLQKDLIVQTGDGGTKCKPSLTKQQNQWQQNTFKIKA